MSIQDGRRISEAIRLTIGNGEIYGSGDDADGTFTLEGNYEGDEVVLIRRYTTVTSAMGTVGYPYRYLGRWDGAMISGRWAALLAPRLSGPFEMWPEGEEELKELRIEFAELVAPA